VERQHRPRQQRLRTARLAVAAVALALGLLLWARVIVIARMPRHAVADEEPAAAVEAAAPPAAPSDAP
jgi:hypothetical protein